MDIRKKISSGKFSAGESKSSDESHQRIKTEQRKYPRNELSCPVEVVMGSGSNKKILAQSRTDNISDGGCYLTISSSAPVRVGSAVDLNLKIPRQTPNTYLLEVRQTSARVVRFEAGRRMKLITSFDKNNPESGLALEFAHPIELSLD